MKKFPEITEESLLVRTDFSDDVAWIDLCKALQEPSEEGFLAYLHFISDKAYEGLTVEQLVAFVLENGNHPLVFLADQITFTNSEQTILIVDFYEEVGRTFRVIPSEMWGIENNLSISNMDFRDFADNVDPDGVFRGYPDPAAGG
ncbi:MAG: hypothetical protein ACFCU9_06810 [Cyanophyceae cyanobacterium]